MKQIIVAILNCNLYKDRKQIDNLSNKEFIEGAKHKLTLKEFEQIFNDDEINYNNDIIRFIEVELEVKSCK